LDGGVFVLFVERAALVEDYRSGIFEGYEDCFFAEVFGAAGFGLLVGDGGGTVGHGAEGEGADEAVRRDFRKAPDGDVVADAFEGHTGGDVEAFDEAGADGNRADDGDPGDLL